MIAAVPIKNMTMDDFLNGGFEAALQPQSRSEDGQGRSLHGLCLLIIEY